MPKDKLRVMGMIFHAYHGCYDGERENGQRFEIDVEMSYDTRPAALSDRLKDTIDVRQVYENVRKIVEQDRFYLIETISQQIANNLLDHFPIESVRIRLRKPFAPLGGLANGTEIEITRYRHSAEQ
ncbi:MAG TPA: dihydroneopterin aldolase [bacterium]|nr:dihydroneopterin aldolase [bacterium]HNT64887.1 dihydroneopterin aldolase [bacterium]HOX84945.1 dihydroneopterin aldolase [bacterium]HPG44189.1 dihydroneopterin aldolase [bacterium]HPM96556.1 dihydroneopterin aldolase [bacterium]